MYQIQTDVYIGLNKRLREPHVDSGYREEPVPRRTSGEGKKKSGPLPDSDEVLPAVPSSLPSDYYGSDVELINPDSSLFLCSPVSFQFTSLHFY